VSDLCIPRIAGCSRIGRPSRKYINLSQIYECMNWETEQYNSVLEITVSFLGIRKWEPDIYIGFSSPFICSEFRVSSQASIPVERGFYSPLFSNQLLAEAD
jgi:hypothetical protein